MKNIILKQLLIVVSLIISTSSTQAEEYGYKNPKWLYSSTDCITISNVHFTDSVTILDIHEKHIPTWWVKIHQNTVLIDQDGKRYKLLKGEGVTPNELFITPECGYADFKLYFEPMPSNTDFFDYIAGYKPGDFRILGVHSSDNPIRVPNFLPNLDVKEYERQFYNTGTVVLKGKIEDYSEDNELKSILMTRRDVITNTYSTVTIGINPDGTFETSFKANHPKFEQLRIQDNNNTLFYEIYIVPGCTTELYFDKDLNMSMSSKDKEVWECQRLVNHNIFDICMPKPYMERYNMCKYMSFNQFSSALQSEKELQLKLIDYVAWREQFTQLEQYYAKLITELEYSKAIFDYYYHVEMHLADSSLSETEREFLTNEYQKDPYIEEYEFIKSAPHNDIACLAIPSFYFLINRYQYSKILFPEIYKSGTIVYHSNNPFKYLLNRNNKIFTTDMAITENSEPSIWAVIVTLQDAEHYLNDVLVIKKRWQKSYYKYLKGLTYNYPVIISAL